MITRAWLVCGVAMALVSCQVTTESPPKEPPVKEPLLAASLLEHNVLPPEALVGESSTVSELYKISAHQHEYVDDVSAGPEEGARENEWQESVARLYASPSLNPSNITTANITSPSVSANIKKHHDGKRPQIAIIIDDLGYQRAQSTALLAIGEPLSYAVIPNTPHAETIATDVVDAKQELMLHVPMETISVRKWEQGLTEDMSPETFNEHVDDMLNDYPFAKGINNHGGSLLTQNSEKMQWLMSSLKPRGLFFVDSRTTPASVAREVAVQSDVPSASRDVFLDNDKNAQAIAKSFERVKRLAKKNGHAIAIGHPYPQTIAFLTEHLPSVSSQGFELVFMSELLHNMPVLNDTK